MNLLDVLTIGLIVGGLTGLFLLYRKLQQCEDEEPGDEE